VRVAQAEAAQAAARLAGFTSHEGSLLKRYATAHGRMFQSAINTFLKVRKAFNDGTLDPPGEIDDAVILAQAEQAVRDGAGQNGADPTLHNAVSPTPQTPSYLDTLVTQTLHTPCPWELEPRLRNEPERNSAVSEKKEPPKPKPPPGPPPPMDVNVPSPPPPPAPPIPTAQPEQPRPVSSPAPIVTAPMPQPAAPSAPLARTPRSETRYDSAWEKEREWRNQRTPRAQPESLEAKIERLRIAERDYEADRPPKAKEGWGPIPHPFAVGYEDYDRYLRMLDTEFGVKSTDDFRRTYNCEPP
jgi:hypothetical protein